MVLSHPRPARARQIQYWLLIPVLAVTAAVLLASCIAAAPVRVQPYLQAVRLTQDRQVQLQLQNPQLPNGCEVTSLAMLLSWAGYPVDKEELYQSYLPRSALSQDANGRLLSGDPEEVYVGDAASQRGGWYCFEAPIKEAGDCYLSCQGVREMVQIFSGLTQNQLDSLLGEGVPLAIWVTLNYAPPRFCSSGWTLPDGSTYLPYSNLHCVVLTARDGDNYLTADPLGGWQWVDAQTLWDSFDAMGRRAVCVL